MTPSFLLDELFQGQCKNIDELSADHPLLKSGKLAGNTFTLLVDFLRSPTNKNQSVRSLMGLFWDLVGNRITPTAITNGVPTLSFYAERMDGRFNGFVLCPENWCQMIKEDFSMHLGALVFNASKARDYWNLKLVGMCPTSDKDNKATFIRAYSYEAELLLGLPDLKPNEYQKKVLNDFPFGLDTPGVSDFHYQSRPYPSEGPPFPFDVNKHETGAGRP